MTNSLRDAWYVAGFADAFTPGTWGARTLLAQAMVLYRTAEGGIAALSDRCPQRRWAPRARTSSARPTAPGSNVRTPNPGRTSSRDRVCGQRRWPCHHTEEIS
jgi:hypothetical protein